MYFLIQFKIEARTIKNMEPLKTWVYTNVSDQKKSAFKRDRINKRAKFQF